MFCTHCGAANQESARFCINCARPLNEVEIERKLSKSRSKNFDSLQGLVDFSFKRYFSPGIMKSLYPLSILFAGLIAVFLVIAGFRISIWFGIFALLIGAPLVFYLMTFSCRIFLETILVIFRIAENTNNISATNIGLPTAEEKAEPRDGIQWNV